MNRRRKFMLAAALLLAIHVVVLFAGFFAPYDPAEQDRTAPFAPPTHIHFRDAAGKYHLRPVVYALTVAEGTLDRYVEDRSRAFPVKFFVSDAEYRIAGLFRARTHLFGAEAPARITLLGTDAYGRDQFSRLLYGGRVSLAAGLLAAVLALTAGTLLGVIAGFYGGWIDDLLMRVSELFVALPWLYLLLATRAFLPLHIEPETAFLLLVAIIGLVGWARPARLVRGVALSARERGFVLAARGFGASNAYLLRRHVLPQASGVILTQAALLVPQYILAEVTLSFLGIGVAEPAASWGNMLAALQQYHVLVSYWWMWAPAGVLVPVFLLFNTVAEQLQYRIQSQA